MILQLSYYRLEFKKLIKELIYLALLKFLTELSQLNNSLSKPSYHFVAQTWFVRHWFCMTLQFMAWDGQWRINIFW